MARGQCVGGLGDTPGEGPHCSPCLSFPVVLGGTAVGEVGEHPPLSCSPPCPRPAPPAPCLHPLRPQKLGHRGPSNCRDCQASAALADHVLWGRQPCPPVAIDTHVNTGRLNLRAGPRAPRGQGSRLGDAERPHHRGHCRTARCSPRSACLDCATERAPKGPSDRSKPRWEPRSGEWARGPGP